MHRKPECRYCGARVEYFGDVCASCDTDSDDDDGMVAITAADLARLSDKAE